VQTAQRAVRAHQPYFDGIRALAATEIFLFHANGQSPSNVGWYTSLLPGVRGSVHVFFVLSAFLLYQPWAAAHLGDRSKPSVRDFAKGRFLRLMPAYWVAVVGATLIGRTDLSNPTDWFVHLTLTQVYSTAEPFKGIVVNWTLSIELCFYLMLPIYAFAIGRLAPRFGVVRTEVGGILALFAIGELFQLWATHSDRWLAQYWFPFFLPSFASGLALAFAMQWVRNRSADDHPIVRFIRRTPYLWIGIAALCFWRAAAVGAVFDRFVPSGTMQDQALFTLMAALLVLPGVFRPSRSTLWNRFFESRPVGFIGLVSYGFYLWHVTIILLIHDDVLHNAPGAGNYWSLVLVAYAASVAVGAASWYWIERPALRLRKRPWTMRSLVRT
jgi:peptidoglycan/LPS O-acetylase OafA/YrhL